jgi:hypothetical protein
VRGVGNREAGLNHCLLSLAAGTLIPALREQPKKGNDTVEQVRTTSQNIESKEMSGRFRTKRVLVRLSKSDVICSSLTYAELVVSFP